MVKKHYIFCMSSPVSFWEILFSVILLCAKLAHFAWHTAVVSPLKWEAPSPCASLAPQTFCKILQRHEVALCVWGADTVLSESVCFWQRCSKILKVLYLYSDTPFLSYFLQPLLRCTEWAERLRSALHFGLLSTMHGLFSLGNFPENSFT